MDPRTERALHGLGGFRTVVARMPPLARPPLPSDWLASEMVERYLIARDSPASPGDRVVEIGAGAHALATVPLAYRVQPDGTVLAVERHRWEHFREVVRASGLDDRVAAVRADARRLPFGGPVADLAVCLHGIRSLGEDVVCVAIFREMLRVARRLFLAETLPSGRTPAQRAHLGMYELREEVFLATTGSRDDLRYRSLDELCRLVERAGGTVESRRTREPDLPHALAYFPRQTVEAIRDPRQRRRLLERWDGAAAELQRSGEDHPPVGLVLARPS